MKFDNHDERIRYYELLLERDLEALPYFLLHEGYGFVFYKQGDRDSWLHWVAVRREYQGRGLAKPLISYVLNVMRGLGYTHAKIPTQTTTWLACRIYLDLGFVPLPPNAINSIDGRKIIRFLTNHAALHSFEPAAIDDIAEVP